MLNDRIKQLAAAQERIVKVADIMEQWELSQNILEKRAYEAINISDITLNYLKGGYQMVDKLRKCYSNVAPRLSPFELEYMEQLLNDVMGLFDDVVSTASEANETSHTMEKEIDHLREIEVDMKQCMEQVGESVDTVLACAELMLLEI